MAKWYDSIKNIFVKEVVSERASRGTIRNSWYSGTMRNDGEPSPIALNYILEHYRLDPVVQAAVSTRVNAILASGWTINGATATVKIANSKLKKLSFNYQLMEKIVFNSILYEHLFLETERTGAGDPAGLHVLETPYMEIVHDEYGTISEFIERGENGDTIRFPVDDITFVKFNSISSAVWGMVGLSSLYRTLTTKNEIEKFLNSLAITNAWRQVFKTSMTKDNIGEFLSYYDYIRQDPTQPFVMQETKSADSNSKDTNKFELLRDPSDLKEFLGTLDYLRTQVLMLLKVPPIMIGLPDSSNRSNSDSQIKAFNIANESVRKKIADAINNDLFPKIGLSNVTFSWNPVDERSEKDDVEIAERLIHMGAKPKMIEQFLRNAGLELPEGELFEEKEELVTPPGKSMDMYPSRRGKSDGESNNKQGSGVDSTTRQDQLHS